MTKLRSYRLFFLLGIASLLIGWRPLLDTFALALRDDQYTHILIIVPVSAALLFLNRRTLGLAGEPGVPLGLTLLVAAALVGVFTRWNAASLPRDLQLSLSMLALVTWWIAAFVIAFGPRAFRRVLFPLCFLYWLVPFPDFLLSRIVSLLQQGSAAAAQLLFTAAGVPVAQDGVVLSIPGLTIEVAKECSSIRSSLMLVVISMVLAHLYLRSIWRKIVVVLAAIALSIAKNGFRIFVLCMLGTRVDPEFLHGNLHRHGGPLFLLLALLVLLGLLWLLSRSDHSAKQKFGDDTHRRLARSR
jgi:exosortase